MPSALPAPALATSHRTGMALAVVAAAFCAAAPAAVHAATTARVSAFTLTQVNQETRQVLPGARVPLCQAIPITELAAHVRWSGAPRDGLRARVELSAPGHRDRPLRRTLRATGRRGVRRVVFTPTALDEAAFTEGLYVVRVRVGGHVLGRAELRFVAPSSSSC